MELETEPRNGDPRVAELAAMHVIEDPFWYAKHDGSLQAGAEFVSHPAAIEYWRAKDLSVLQELRKLGMHSWNTNRCGMHIHISRAGITGLDVFKMLKLFEESPKFVFKISRRRSEDDMGRWAAVPSEGLRYASMAAKGRQVYQRYNALNVQPPETVEVRIFKGTLFEPSFRRNLEFANALVRYVQGTSLAAISTDGLLEWLDQRGPSIVGKEATRILLPWVSECALNTDERSEA